jgi:hypothetical protein
MRPARRTVRTLLAAAVAGTVVATLAPATPAAAVSVTVDKRFFGLHDSDATSWPALSVGSVRLWDAGVSWRDIETAPGVYDFSRLDAQVARANAAGAEVTLVLGLTPNFYASSGVGTEAGKTSMPTNVSAWTNYVRAVVSRYGATSAAPRRIAAYQVWNEANVTGYWTGTPQQMAHLTALTYMTVKSVDRGALVVSPAFASRIGEQIRGITRFAFAWSDGKPAWRWTDVMSLNLYPLDKYGTTVGTPEKSMELLKQARKILGYGGLPSTFPIWNTEINYGMPTGSAGGTGALAIPQQRQAAYVLRTLLLNAANRIRRVDWYAYDLRYLANGRTLGNTRLVDPANTTNGQVTLAGKAFNLAQRWLLGGRLTGASKTALPCAKDRAGTYTCVISYRGGVRRVYWNPTKRVSVTTARSATYKVGVYGVRAKIKGGSTLRVDYRPVMVRSKG